MEVVLVSLFACFDFFCVCGLFVWFFYTIIWFVHDSLHQQPQNIKSIPDAATVSYKNVKDTASLQSAHYVTFKK